MDSIGLERKVGVASPELIVTDEADAASAEINETVSISGSPDEAGDTIQELQDDVVEFRPRGWLGLAPELVPMYLRAMVVPLCFAAVASCAILIGCCDFKEAPSGWSWFESEYYRSVDWSHFPPALFTYGGMLFLFPVLAAGYGLHKRFVRASRILDQPRSARKTVELRGETDRMHMRIGDDLQELLLVRKTGLALKSAESGDLVSGSSPDDPVLVKTPTRLLWLERRSSSPEVGDDGEEEPSPCRGKVLAIAVVLLIACFGLRDFGLTLNPGGAVSPFFIQIAGWLLFSGVLHKLLRGTGGRAVFGDTLRVVTISVVFCFVLNFFSGYIAFPLVAIFGALRLKRVHKVGIWSVVACLLVVSYLCVHFFQDMSALCLARYYY